MADLKRTTTSRYLAAVAATVVALGIRLLVGQWIENTSAFLLFTPAVMISAWYGGMGPGLLATAAGALLGNFFVLEPPFDPENLGKITVFVFVGIQISWLSGQMHRATARAEQARDALQSANENLERRVRERTAELHFQKTLLESQNQASLDAILAVSDDRRIIFANRRFNEMWRIPFEASPPSLDLVRRRMRDRLTEGREPLPVESPDDSEDGDRRIAQELTFADGRAIECHSAPILDPVGTSYGRVWFFRDITERNRLQREILEVGERERQRIGQDLHDDLCQQLTGVACLGRVLQQRLATHDGHDGGPSEEDAAKIVHLVQQATQRARDLAKGLLPVQLQKNSLAEALAELCNSIEGMFHISCTFRGDETASVGDAAATQLYRIAQEAISNAIRHGQATHVLLDLVAARHRVVMTIEDDGAGLPEPPPKRGLGLHTMSYRARMIGGSLTIERGHPRGTVVSCSIPAHQVNQVNEDQSQTRD